MSSLGLCALIGGKCRYVRRVPYWRRKGGLVRVWDRRGSCCILYIWSLLLPLQGLISNRQKVEGGEQWWPADEGAGLLRLHWSRLHVSSCWVSRRPGGFGNLSVTSSGPQRLPGSVLTVIKCSYCLISASLLSRALWAWSCSVAGAQAPKTAPSAGLSWTCMNYSIFAQQKRDRNIQEKQKQLNGHLEFMIMQCGCNSMYMQWHRLACQYIFIKTKITSFLGKFFILTHMCIFTIYVNYEMHMYIISSFPWTIIHSS